MKNGLHWHLVVTVFLAILILGLGAGNSLAKDEGSYPTKPIKLLCPWPTGGAGDINARAMAKYASKYMGQPVIVENKPGGLGLPTLQENYQAAPDGYVLLPDTHASTSMMLAGIPDLPFEIWNRSWIGRYVTDSVFYFVQADSEWKTLADVAAAAKKDPQNFLWGTLGGGGLAGFAVAQFLDAAGIDPRATKMVVFQGSAPNLAALAGKHTRFTAQQTAESLPLVSAGKIRPVAVVGKSRSPVFPDVPTVAEAGYPTLNINGWHGVSGPAKLPKPIIDKWVKVLKDVTSDPEFIAESKKLGKNVSLLLLEEYEKSMKQEYEAYKSLAPLFRVTGSK